MTKNDPLTPSCNSEEAIIGSVYIHCRNHTPARQTANQLYFKGWRLECLSERIRLSLQNSDIYLEWRLANPKKKVHWSALVPGQFLRQLEIDERDDYQEVLTYLDRLTRYVPVLNQRARQQMS